MTHDRSVQYTFDAIDRSMPGMFLIRTITGTMHIVINDLGGESVVRQARHQANSKLVGDSDWLPVEYTEIRIGHEASFQFVRSEIHGEAPAHVGKSRRISRVMQIALYDGYPELTAPDAFGTPRGLPVLNEKETP